MRQVTRLEIVDLLGDAFLRRPLTKHSLMAEALMRDARGEILEVIDRLPEKVFLEPRALWRHLPGLPVGDWLMGSSGRSDE